MSTFAQRLTLARERAGLSQAALAKAVGIKQPSIAALESGRAQSSAKAVQLAQALGVNALWLAEGTGEMTAPLDAGTVPIGSVGHLRVLYRVAAGSWVETDETSQELEEYAPISPRPDIPLTDQWAEIVVGDSFNLHYPEGTMLHVRGGWAFDPRAPRARPPRVIVARKRAGGLLVERTIKEAVVNAAGEVELWPRSTNPRWSKPVPLHSGTRPGEELTVEIVGLVIGAYLPA